MLAACCWYRASPRKRSTIRPARAGASSPRSPGRATGSSATGCTSSDEPMNTAPPTECRAWADLVHHAESWRAVHLRDLFATDVTRPVLFAAEAEGVRLDFSRQRIGAMTLRMLARLAGERGLPQWRDGLFGGAKLNSTEERAAWHTALRSGGSLPPEVRQTLTQMKALSDRIRNEGKIRRVVNLRS